MNGRIEILGASRLSNSGPASDDWSLEFVAHLGGEHTYRGLVRVWPVNQRERTTQLLKVLPDDVPTWLPLGALDERAHWYVVQMLEPTLRGRTDRPLRVDDPVTEEFEVTDGDWTYLGVTQT